MPPITSLSASSVPPADLKVILADYLALDRARIFRRLFVIRFGLLAVVAAIVSVAFPSLPAFARWFPPTMCLAPPLAAWICEWRLAQRLTRQLDEKVVKSS
jgi:hypothetical protein